MKFSRWLTDKFTTFGRCSGKTFSIRQQALTEFNTGKKCAIVTNWDSYTREEHFKLVPNNPVAYEPDGKSIDVWKLNIVLKVIQGPGRHIDPSSCWWKAYSQFSQYDYVYVDADCYEYLIQQLIKQLMSIRYSTIKLKDKLKNIENLADEILEDCEE